MSLNAYCIVLVDFDFSINVDPFAEYTVTALVSERILRLLENVEEKMLAQHFTIAQAEGHPIEIFLSLLSPYVSLSTNQPGLWTFSSGYIDQSGRRERMRDVLKVMYATGEEAQQHVLEQQRQGGSQR